MCFSKSNNIETCRNWVKEVRKNGAEKEGIQRRCAIGT